MIQDEMAPGETRNLLLAVMEERSSRIPPAPGWSVIRGGLLRVRRRRRLRAAAALSAGLVIVFGSSIALTSVSSRVNGNEPTSRSPAGSGPVLGAKLGSGWEGTLRRRAVSEGEIAVGDGGPLSPPDAASIDVVFARDVGPYRMALVRGTWSAQEARGRSRTVLQRWFVGPAGARADQLQDGAVTVGKARVTAQVVQPGAGQVTTPAMRATGVALVIASSGSADVRLAGPAQYSAAGMASLRLGPPLAASARGVYVTAIPPDGAHRLIVNGSRDLGTGLVVPVRWIKTPGSTHKVHAMMSDEVATDLSRSVAAIRVPPLPRTAQRGGPVPPPVVLQTAARLVQSRSGLAVTSSRLDLVSALPYYDSAGRVTEWTVLMTATDPSGARFLGAVQVRADGRMQYGDDLEAWVLAPRGSLDRLAMAWPSAGISEGTVRPGGLIRFIGPRTATSAQILGPSGAVVLTVPIRGGIAVDGGVSHSPMKRVRFLDSSGRLLKQVLVLPYAGGKIPLPMDSWPDRT